MAYLEEPLSGPLIESLKRGRDRFNSRFALARQAFSGLDEELFARQLARKVDPVVLAVHKNFPESVDALVDSLFDLSLTMLGKGYIGSSPRFPFFLTFWSRLLPSIPAMLALDAGKVSRALANAILQFSQTPKIRFDFWLTELIALAPMCQKVDDFFATGKILAWRSGMPQLRDEAFSCLAGLPGELASRALGMTNLAPANLWRILDRLQKDPWLTPNQAEVSSKSSELILVSRVGGFRGFGGPFLNPPMVVSDGSDIYAEDEEQTLILLADFTGASLQSSPGFSPQNHAPPRGDTPSKNVPPMELSGYWPSVAGTPSAGSPFSINKDGLVSHSKTQKQFSELARNISWAANQHMIVVTLPHSHFLYILAFAEKAPA